MEKLEHACTVGGNIKWYKAAMKYCTVLPQKIKNRITLCSSNSTSGYISKRIESRVSRTYLFTDICSSIIYNSQKVEATQVSDTGCTEIYLTLLNHTLKMVKMVNFMLCFTTIKNKMLLKGTVSQSEQI